MSVLLPEIERLGHTQPVRIIGRVAELRGLTLLVDDLPMPVGSLVRVGAIPGEVVGFRDRQTIVMLLGHTVGIRSGDAVEGAQASPTAPVGPRLLGRVVDGLGRPIDGLGPIHETRARPLNPAPIAALERRRITRNLRTGVRAIDLMTPLGRGQRMGIFAGPGVGKSTLLGQIATGTEADVNIIALIGERGREVRDFLEESLGPDGLARSVVVVATGDEAPLLRIRAAKLACCAAEFFRDRGLDVLLMMDSVTRFAHAQRQVGLSIGEPPATKGYTPSVFAEMGLLLERAGAVGGDVGGQSGTQGSITGLYTILVEGDDTTEPVSDAARGILDGHLILSRKLAQRGHFPAIDVLDSISRVAPDVVNTEHMAARQQLVRLLAAHDEIEDLVQIGAYARGSNPLSDTAIEYHDTINQLLIQQRTETVDTGDAIKLMSRIAHESGDALLARTQHLSAGGRQAPAGVDRK